MLIERLGQLYTTMSRVRMKEYISAGRVEVDGRVCRKATALVDRRARVKILSKPQTRPYVGRGLDWLWEDRWLIFVVKHSGLLSAPNREGELSAKTLLDQYFDRTHQRCRAHVVHRLDKETSGVMVFAKQIEAERRLESAWHEHVVDRRYVALVSQPPVRREGTVISWLKENSAYLVYSSPTDNGGKRAVTHYKVIDSRLPQGRALIELKLETGRKNQIRVHLSDLGCPVCGDYKYGSQEDPENRLCLHAFRLQLRHPITGEILSFETPLPRWGRG
ncbi:MAG: RluA family pseudouridine synthase [Alloprevotella sp.]|nr:RluA family pseudouridine synthase [Alloprevotella sp.]